MPMMIDDDECSRIDDGCWMMVDGITVNEK
jgi:hypothetical protein